jgi:hypothetical protein
MGLKQLEQYRAKYGAGLNYPFTVAGAPVSGASGSYVGRAVVGSQLIDVTNGKMYVATVATSSTVTWTVTGSQT